MAQDTGQDLELSERHLAQRDGQAQFLEAVEQVLGTLARTAGPSGGVANLLQGEQRVQGVDRASAGRRCRLGRPVIQAAGKAPAPCRGPPSQERRVWKEGVSTCSFRWSPCHSKKN